MNGKVVLEGNQKKVAQYISSKRSASHSDIMEGTDLAASSVSRATNKLQEYEIIEDVDKRPNKTKYQIVEQVDIKNEMEFGSFFSKTTVSQVIGIVMLIIYTFIIGDVSNRAVIFAAGIISILPTVLFSFYRSLDEKVYAVDRT